MSSTPQKPTSKMCKSPKNSNFHAIKSEKIINEYENFSTNCTVIGSNNLHLVKKPQVITSVSPAYSNPSPGYPQSPYSSPASLKSPSPQNFKPPTPQPTYPVMQIIQSSHQLLARPLQSQPQNVIKLKPHLNILPKPSASPQPSPKPSVSPHIVIPSQQTTTIMPTAQPLLLNQMPMLAPGVQLILRPQTTKLPTHMQTSATAQGLILQPSHQQVLQIQSPRATQQMVRVLTNGMHLAPHTQVVSQVASPVITQSTTQHAHMMHHNEHNLAISYANSNSPPKKKPKKKKQKLDLANIMKLSGIGDEDDIQFESDTSQSESEPNTVQLHSDIHQTHNVIQEANIIRSQANVIQATDVGKRLGNIQFSTIPQATAQTPLVQLLNQGFPNGVNNASFQTSQPQAGIPLNSFITPNITINNGLVVQRNGGFKLALGEDGRLVLQHDPTLHQDLQSQLLLQSLFGLNGLVLQPSIDQQVHSQTVQTIQQQSVQTIQQQTVQSQTIQTVQQQTVQPHTLPTMQQTIQPQIQAVQPQTVQQTVQQTIQHQTVQSQPLPTLHQHPHSQPMQIVQPQPIHTIQSHNIQQHTIQSQPVASLPSPVVHAIQSQVHQSIQSQIQGQLQTLLQSQSLQALQPQPVHSHAQSSHVTSTIQSHPQTQPILKVQPFHKTQPPVQTVHPQPVQTIQHHQTHQTLSDNATHQPQPPQPQYVVNLTPDQLEQLKRNGQISVNGQTIFMQRPNVVNKAPEQVHHQNNENKVKLSPKIKTVKKTNKIATNALPVKTLTPDNVGLKSTDDKSVNNVIKEAPKSSLVSALQAPPKIAPVQNHVQVQPQQKAHSQPSAVIQPSIAVQPTVQTSVGSQTQLSKPPVQSKLHQAKLPNTHAPNPDSSTGNNQEMDHLIGQILEESNTSSNVPTTSNNQVQPPQRIHTIQLTPQQQQHLKSVQLQIQTLSARLTPGDTEMHNALKLLFAEQQKILASGKLLPPDKVIYQNNQLTIINPSSLGIGNLPIKSEPQVLQAPVLPRTINSETCNSHPISTTVPVQQVPKITVSIPTVTEHVTHSKTAPTQSIKVAAAPSVQSTASTHVHQNKFIPSFTKAQLLEQQLNTDQNGAMKPDVYTPFRDKADACKRLIRYHCYNQPVLSQKDLNKADEIFELTAKHFIDKFRRMVDKYRFLLNKESMRQVQTSELMMLDRLFYAEEQQSMMRLRQDMEEGSSHYSVESDMHDSSNPLGQSPQEEYDEWACIQRELGCLQSNVDDPKQLSSAQQQKLLSLSLQAGSNLTNNLSSKRSASSDSRLETLKKFRVDKHNKRLVGEGGGVNVQNNFISGIQSNNFTVSGGGSGGGLKVPQRNAQVQQIITNVQNTQSSPTGSNVQSARQNVHVSLQQQQQVVHNQQHGTRSVHYATHSGAQNVFHSTNISHHHHQYVQYSQGQDIGPNLHSLYGGGQIIQQHGALQQNMTTNSVYNNANNNLSVNNKMNSGSLSSESESGNNSIDEHVQSAIDSILNLQQSSNLDLDEAVSSILS